MEYFLLLLLVVPTLFLTFKIYIDKKYLLMNFWHIYCFLDVDYFFKKKLFIEFVTILFLFLVLWWAHGMWDLRSPARD